MLIILFALIAAAAAVGICWAAGAFASLMWLWLLVVWRSARFSMPAKPA